MHLTFNDNLDPTCVIGLLYLPVPQTQGPDVRMLGEQCGHLQVPRAMWPQFKAAWEAAGHTASWGFN